LGLVASEEIAWDSKEEAAGKKESSKGSKEGMNERRKKARNE